MDDQELTSLTFHQGEDSEGTCNYSSEEGFKSDKGGYEERTVRKDH